MQAIQTKYFGATNFRGARVKATCERGSLTIDYPHELNRNELGAYAAKQLIAKFCAQDLKQYGTPIESNPWNRPFVSGSLPDGTECHVFTS